MKKLEKETVSIFYSKTEDRVIPVYSQTKGNPPPRYIKICECNLTAIRTKIYDPKSPCVDGEGIFFVQVKEDCHEPNVIVFAHNMEEVEKKWKEKSKSIIEISEELMYILLGKELAKRVHTSL